jgi:predicted negative regulator of RcsB-dependent stress response
MAYDLEEQEQLDSIKAWWNQYGSLVSWLLTIVLVAYAGWNGWKYYEKSQSAQASQLYEELQKAVQGKDGPRVQRAASDMETKFGGTAYAGMAALTAAKSAYDAGDTKVAKEQLGWVISNGKGDDYKAIARIRLAGILLDEKAYDEAQKQLDASFPAQFESMVADRKGDILVAQNKTDQAKQEYKRAFDKSDKNNPGRQLIQLKLDALGGADVKAAS